MSYGGNNRDDTSQVILKETDIGATSDTIEAPTGLSRNAKIGIVVVIAILLVVGGFLLWWFVFREKPEETTPATTPPATTPPATTPNNNTNTGGNTNGGDTNGNTGGDVTNGDTSGNGDETNGTWQSCYILNENYRNIASDLWTNEDRNIAIWLINKVSPTITDATLSRLSNAQLELLLKNICDSPKDCKLLNSYYSGRDYENWIEDDRNTAIWLLTRNGSDLRVLSGLNDEQLYPLVNRHCQNVL